MATKIRFTNNKTAKSTHHITIPISNEPRNERWGQNIMQNTIHLHINRFQTTTEMFTHCTHEIDSFCRRQEIICTDFLHLISFHSRYNRIALPAHTHRQQYIIQHTFNRTNERSDENGNDGEWVKNKKRWTIRSELKFYWNFATKINTIPFVRFLIHFLLVRFCSISTLYFAILLSCFAISFAFRHCHCNDYYTFLINRNLHMLWAEWKRPITATTRVAQWKKATQTRKMEEMEANNTSACIYGGKQTAKAMAMAHKIQLSKEHRSVWYQRQY